jgi:putative ABC transport system permease protein
VAESILKIKGISQSNDNMRTSAEDWAEFCDRLVLLRVAEAMDRPDAIMGSLRRLRQEIADGLFRATTILTWLPALVLVIASLGIGNLMMVNVQSRARQIAVLRAVGAVKSQIVRLVLAEAITIGILGSLIGCGLGLHQAWNLNLITSSLIGVTLKFIVPFGTVAGSIALTIGICLSAGIGPARYAARNNIIEAMQTP